MFLYKSWRQKVVLQSKVSLATPELLACAMNEEDSLQPFAQILTILHVAAGLHAFVMVREVDEYELRVSGLLHNNVI